MKIALVIVSLALFGCGTTKEARIYDMASATVIHATFNYQGGQGPITATLPNGASCTGEYSTIPSGTRSWGGIYNTGGLVGALGSGTTSASHRGSAVVICEGGFTMECEYMTSGLTTGNGFCNDNKGVRYRLMY